MNLLQRIVRLLRKLFNSTPVRLTIGSILALYNFLARRGRKWTVKKERTNARPDLTGKNPSFGLPTPSISPPEGVISAASRIPDSLYPYPFSGRNASVSSQDISASSIHTDASAQQSSQQLQYISHTTPTRTRPSDHRSRSNPHIDIPSISGQHLYISGSASRVSSRPNSLYGQTLGSRPPSFHGQLSVSRPISPYTSRHGSGSQVSIPPSITIDRGPDEEGFDTAPLQTSPIQEDSPFTHLENQDEPGFKQLSELYERFCPIPPEYYPRYERSIYVPDERTTYTVKPLTYSFRLEEKIPAEWKKKIHPEGACYYVYQNGRYYTDANIMDDLTKDRIVACINDFDDFIRSRSIQLSSRTNTVFNLHTDPYDPDKYTCQYYIADHATRSVFWLDAVDAESFPVWGEVKGVTSPTHIEHAVVSLYWYHCHLFPHSYDLTIEAVDELRDILLHCICDTITSSTSTVPYSVADLKEMMILLNNLRKNPSTGGGVSAYSRIMYIFARLRFLHFHGQPAARLDRDQSVHHNADRLQNRRPWWMKCLSPALFSAPDLYYRILSNLWVDNLVHEAAWSDFVNKMNEEWQQLILFNTVLLNANVAFLAIQSIDDSSDSPGRSPEQIASFLSIVASFGSIILGLVLARKHRAKAKDTAEDAAKFLNSWERNRLGIASLAILYSVPYALLLWGVLCFLVAFSFMCYIDSDILIRSLMSSAWFVVAVLVLWCVTALASWDHRSNDQESFWSYVHELLSYLLFGLWWSIDGAFTMIANSWRLLNARQTTVQAARQQPIELQNTNTRKSSVGTAVGELWRRSSLFNKADRKGTDDTQVTAVETQC
ncbi:hypothetical protein GGU10DRAFT_306920 [Lentinula aff. detonsa]|uniref:WW domain-containing protein n=1 Tax=Lentinula aff. detonsa TaxID=2804958 RepID=A0AA38KS17_9AGAR|nr:hypothetical protein GGU10DRAFT_306920 [Lentinula aff. detonsa]